MAIKSEQAYKVLLALADCVTARIRADGAKAFYVAVSIRSNDFKTRSHQRSLMDPTDISKEVYQISKKLFDELWDGRTPLRLIGIFMTNITREETAQMSLFPDENRDKARKLDKAYDAINSKFGSANVVRGSSMKSNLNVGRKYQAQIEQKSKTFRSSGQFGNLTSTREFDFMKVRRIDRVFSLFFLLATLIISIICNIGDFSAGARGEMNPLTLVITTIYVIYCSAFALFSRKKKSILAIAILGASTLIVAVLGLLFSIFRLTTGAIIPFTIVFLSPFQGLVAIMSGNWIIIYSIIMPLAFYGFYSVSIENIT